MNAKPGEIWLADLGLAAKTRPVLIISRHGMKGELSIGKWKECRYNGGYGFDKIHLLVGRRSLARLSIPINGLRGSRSKTWNPICADCIKT